MKNCVCDTNAQGRGSTNKIFKCGLIGVTKFDNRHRSEDADVMRGCGCRSRCRSRRRSIIIRINTLANAWSTAGAGPAARWVFILGMPAGTTVSAEIWWEGER